MMDLFLKYDYKFDFNVSDFAIDMLNKHIICVGDRLAVVKEEKNLNIIKSVRSKFKKSVNIRFIKYDNQLFQSNDFYVISENTNVLMVSGKNKSIKKTIKLNEKNIENIVISSSEKIAYISNNMLYIHDILKETNKVYSLRDLGYGRYKIYISGENVLIKHRKINEKNISIIILNLENLSNIFSIESSVNHIYSKIIGYDFYASTEDGQIEKWNILKKDVIASYKISDSKIVYFDNYENMFFAADSSGYVIVLDDNFNILNKVKVFNGEILKLIVFNNEVYVLSNDNRIKIYDMLNFSENDNIVDEFLKKYNIHESYKEFFTKERFIKIKYFLDELESSKIKYVPKKENIFKALSTNLYDIKVCIMGKDPYFQEGVATGLAFEVKSDNWIDEKINTSLKNILKLIYKTYNNEIKDINFIRNEIEKGRFKILSPSKLFESWQKQGVLLLNSSLTTLLNKAGEHHKYWKPITSELLEYISLKNNKIVYLLWGKDAINLEKYIKNSFIIKHDHPAICGKLDKENDFMNGKSFAETKNLINWLGE